MPEFPSSDWMAAYADTVADHPGSEDLSAALEGRFRFVITDGGGFTGRQSHDLVVEPGGRFTAAPSDPAVPASLTVTAGYDRWKGLITGSADFVMSFLMRRIRVDGDVAGLRSRVRDAGPLLQCLRDVPTTFPH